MVRRSVRLSRFFRTLVNGAEDFFAAQRGDYAFDLPPVAEPRDIALVAAALGADRGLQTGIVAITIDELGRIVERRSAMNEGCCHGPGIGTASFDCAARCGERRVHHDLARIQNRMASKSPLWHSGAMDQRNARGGGFFLTASIFIGLVAGIALGSPITGAVAGTLAGIGLALAAWLIDSRKPR